MSKQEKRKREQDEEEKGEKVTEKKARSSSWKPDVSDAKAEKPDPNTKKHRYALTFGDQAEIRKGMKMSGTPLAHGFTPEDIKQFDLPDQEVTDLVQFLPVEHRGKLKATFYCARNGVDNVMEKKGAKDCILEELKRGPFDSQILNKGKVMYARKRLNNCFGDQGQKADPANGIGTIIAFEDAPYIKELREKLPSKFGPLAVNLQAETNFYHKAKSHIPFHGDSERKMVICGSFGADAFIMFQWFINCHPVGTPFRCKLSHGDLYIMDDTATGHNWKKSSIPTLRHAAGSDESAFTIKLKDKTKEKTNKAEKSKKKKSKKTKKASDGEEASSSD